MRVTAHQSAQKSTWVDDPVATPPLVHMYCSVIQVTQDETHQGSDLSHQHRPVDESSQAATDSAATSASWQQTGSHATQSSAVPKHEPPIDVACSSAIEQVTVRSSQSPKDSSVSLPGSSQPVLLPAGTTSAVPCQLSNEAAAAQSPSAHATVDALMPAPSLQQTTNAGALRSEADSLDLTCTARPGVVLPHQLDFLLTDDPVATAILEANKVVADRAGLMSLADQRREALNLHVQAKDTYFAAAQTAHEKGEVLLCCIFTVYCKFTTISVALLEGCGISISMLGCLYKIWSFLHCFSIALQQSEMHICMDKVHALHLMTAPYDKSCWEGLGNVLASHKQKVMVGA